MSRRVPRLFVAFLAVAGLILATGLFSFLQLGVLHDQLHDVGSLHMPKLDLIRQFDIVADGYRRAQLQHVIEPDSAIEAEIDRLGRTADDLLARLSQLALGDDRVVDEEVSAAWEAYKAESAAFLVPSRADNNPAAIGVLNGNAREAFENLSAALEAWGSTTGRASADAIEQNSLSFDVAQPVGLGLTMLAAVVAVLLGVAVTRAVAREGRRAAAAAERTAEDERTAATINRFTELTALTDDDVSVSEATLATLDELLHPDAATLHVANRSQDRAVPEAALGAATAESCRAVSWPAARHSAAAASM